MPTEVAARRALTLDLAVGDTVEIGSGVSLVIDRRKGSRVKIRFIADQRIPVRKLAGMKNAAKAEVDEDPQRDRQVA